VAHSTTGSCSLTRIPEAPIWSDDLRFNRMERGFSLVELAVVMVIVGLLLGGMIATLSVQIDQRNHSETQFRLEAAREALLAYAIANGRLPCPATSASAGAEVRLATGVCGATGTAFDYYGGVSGGVTGGLLPAVTLGFQPVDTSGFAIDAWGNRIRYAVSMVTTPAHPANFTNRTNLQTNGLGVLPNDLVVCSESPATVAAAACDANKSVTNTLTVVAIVFSTGKNGATGGTGTNEARNVDGNALFVSRTPDPATATGGEFDDLLVWIPVGILYSRLISAGLLP